MLLRFVNFDLGWDSSNGRMYGFTDVAFGSPSRFDATLQGQVVEVDVKDEREYLRIIRELKAAYHLPLRKWVPLPDFKSAVDEIMPLPPGVQYAVPESAANHLQINDAEVALVLGKPPLDGKPFFALRKIAKEEGADISNAHGVAEVRAAIEAHRKAA